MHVAMDADGMIPEALREAIAYCTKAGKRVKFLYVIPNYQNPAGVSLSLAASPGDPRDRRGGRRAGRRGRPLRPARLRRRAVPGDARRRRRSCALPGHFQQDDRPRAAGRLGARPARRTREAGAGQRGADPVPADLQPAGDLALPGDPALAGAGQDLPRDLPRAARRAARRPRHRICPPAAPGPCRPAGSTSG